MMMKSAAPVPMLIALLTAACASEPQIVPLPPPGPAEAARHRAALATLHVENRTPHNLTIVYRVAAEAGAASVAIGTALAGTRAAMAPVPAGEPIVLSARTADGAALEMAPRTFEVNQEWLWIVPRDAVFRRQPPAP